MRVMILKATRGFQYEVVNIFAQELAEGFADLGWDVELTEANQSKEALFKEVFGAIHSGLDLVLNFNGFLADSTNGFHLLYECFKACKIPVGVILVDHPFFHDTRIKALDRRNTFVCLYDEGYLYSFEKYIDDKMPIVHLMHGGSYAKNASSEKIYDVILAGSFRGVGDFFEQIKDIEEGAFKNTIIKIYNKARTDYKLPLEEYFYQELEKVGVSFEMLQKDSNLNSYLISVFSMMDKCLRENVRYEALKTLLEAGIEVELFGKGKLDEFSKYKNLHMHGPVDYNTLLEEISKSKIVLHDMNACINASHERVLSAMLNKTLVISNYNNFIRDEIKDGESIIYYEVKNMEDLTRKVKYYLSHEKERQAITDRAFEIVDGRHTWRNRAEELINIFEIVKENYLDMNSIE